MSKYLMTGLKHASEGFSAYSGQLDRMRFVMPSPAGLTQDVAPVRSRCTRTHAHVHAHAHARTDGTCHATEGARATGTGMQAASSKMTSLVVPFLGAGPAVRAGHAGVRDANPQACRLPLFTCGSSTPLMSPACGPACSWSTSPELLLTTLPDIGQRPPVGEWVG